MSRVVFPLVIGCVLSCAPMPEDAAPARVEVFGDDRVADVLGRDPARAPRTFAEHEAMFGVGRACGRETFVIEEQGTRFAEVMVPLAHVAPRAIVAGCGTSAELAASYGLFTVMPADPARDALDPLAPAPVEVMALDRRTGTYSFYVFDDSSVQRIVRDASDQVFTLTARRDGAPPTRVPSGPRCYGCHVQGGPIMASLADPWTSWISVRHEKALGSYRGETASVMTRVSGGDELEPIVRNALRVMTVGLPGVPDSGLGPRTLAGLEPGGLPRLLRSVFCETELQWASASDTVPLQLFVDPGAAAGAGLMRPAAGDAFPSLFPIRSEIDQRIEEWLVLRNLLSIETVRVVRLLDDANDVFSRARCSAFDAVLAGLPSEPEKIDAHVRRALAPIVAALPSVPASYARALFGDGDVAAARDAYFTMIRVRLARDVAALGSDRATWEARVSTRRAAARAMFPTSAHPLPLAGVP